jgi:hypothetical protein
MFNKEKLKHASQTNFAKKRKRINYTNDHPFSVQKCMQVNNAIIQETDHFVSKSLNENPLELNNINAYKVSLAGKIIDSSLELSVIHTPIDDLKLQDKVANTNLFCAINAEKSK